MSAIPAARIHESGYRRYDGPRLGPLHSVRALILFTLQRIMGIRRPTRYKVIPAFLILLGYLPATVFVGLAAFLPQRLRGGVLPSYTGYYGFISAVIILLVAYSAPEAFTADRRSKALSLYLAAPLTRTTYLFAQSSAIAIAMCAVTIGPPLLLVIGLTLQGAGPHGVMAVLIALVRILAAGGSMAIFWACVSAGVSSLTDRWALGSGGIILLVLMSNGVSTTLVMGANAPSAIRLLGVGNAMTETVQRIFGQPNVVVPETATAAAIAAALAWAVAGAGLAWWRYQRLQVTR